MAELRQSVEHLPLSTRTQRVLTNAGVSTYGDIYFKDAEHSSSFGGRRAPGSGLLKLRNFGKKSLRELEATFVKKHLPPLHLAHEIAFRILERRLESMLRQNVP